MRSGIIKALLFVVFVIACVLFAYRFHFDVDTIRTTLLQYPLVLSGLLYIGLYVAVTFFVLFGPKDIFRVGGAIIFGPWVSTVLVFIAETLNAVVLFHVSRYFGYEYVQRWLQVKRVDAAHAHATSRVLDLIALRINPLVPFRFLDIGVGLSRIPFRVYAVVVLIASPARILWLQYIVAEVGTRILRPAEIVEYFLVHPFFLRYSAVYFFVVAVLTLAAFSQRKNSQKKEIAVQ